jgi:myosin heavy chain 9/10/11/14
LYFSSSSLTFFLDLLETTRVIHQNDTERNFHIFYQILADSQTKAKLNLTEPNDYTYLNHSGCIRIEGVDDLKEFNETMKSMEVIGMNSNEREFILEVIAGILHLGNVVFTDDEKGLAQIEDKEPMKNCAKLFKVKGSQLEKALIKPNLKVGSEVVEKHETAARANFNRNALVKSIYLRLFNWIVTRVNESLQSKEKIKSWIGVLDIAGFEIFTFNSFEQLCINFTNEKLQQFFNHHMFVKEQEEYQKEKIDWDMIDFGLDLQPTIDLIEKPGGILSILDDAVYAKATDDSRLREQINKKHGKKGNFKLDKFDPKIFNVVHYAGEVPYNVDQWLIKNVDPMNEDCAEAMFASKSKYVSYLFKDVGNPKIKKGGANFNTVSKEYKNQLDSLLEKLNSTEPHFIRCIIPNHIQKPGILDSQLILHQLRCNGVLEGIRISRKGYPGRLLFPEFIQRYGLLASESELKSQSTLKGKAGAILERAELKVKKEFCIGQTKVFLKSGVESKLEALRNVFVDKIIVTIQGAARGHLGRLSYEKLKDQVAGIRLIQDNWRAYAKLKSWSWWELFTRSRPQVELWLQEKERQKLRKQIAELEKAIKDELASKEVIESEKLQLLNEVMKLQADIDAQNEKQLSIKSEEDGIKNKHRELEQTIDNYSREKQMMITNKDKLLRAIRIKEDEIRSKEKEVDSLNTQLREGSNAQTVFQNQIRETSNQKIKLDGQVKRLTEDLTDVKNKLSEVSTKATEFERERNTLDDRLREMGYRIEVIDGEKTQLERKREDSEKDLKELEKKLKKAKGDISNFATGNASKEGLLTNMNNDIADAKKKLEDLLRAIKQLSTLNQDLTKEYLETDRKKSTLEKNLRDTKDDFEEYQSRIAKLQSDVDKQEELLKLESSELLELRNKLLLADDEKSKLSKLKVELEKQFGDLKFNLNDSKEKGQREIESMNKKVLDMERDITEQINQITLAKNGMDRKLREQQKELKDLKKDFDTVTQDKDQLEVQFKRLESTLNSEQGDILKEKQLQSELEGNKKDLTTKLAEIETQLKNDIEANQKIDSKRRELQNGVDEQKNKIDLVEKEKEELSVDKNELLKKQTQHNLDLNELKNELVALNGKSDQQDFELSTLKQRFQDVSSEVSNVKDSNKLFDNRLAELNASLEALKLDKTALTRKLQKLEEQIEKLKKNIQEEIELSKKEAEEKANVEFELRDKTNVLESENINLNDLNSKYAATETKLNELLKLKEELSSEINKLRGQETSLQSQVRSLTDELDELENRIVDNDNTDKELKEKLYQAEKLKEEKMKIKSKLEGDFNKLKNELDIQKGLNEQSEKKGEDSIGTLRTKIEQAESEHEKRVNALNEERESMRKELKSLSKVSLDQGEGKITKEELISTTNELQAQVDKLRRDIEDERREKTSLETTQRTLEIQTNTLKDQFDQEERMRKKITLQKKNVQLEIEELRELADETDDLEVELEALRNEQEGYQVELKNDIQRERAARQAAESSLIKMRREAEDLKKSLVEFKSNHHDGLQKVKKDYEEQLDDLEKTLEREKKGKKSIGASTKRSEKELREMERRLDQVSRDKSNYEDKENQLMREIAKIRDNLQSDGRELAQTEAKNKIFLRDVENAKSKATDLEEEISRLRNEMLRDKKRYQKKSNNVDSGDESD